MNFLSEVDNMARNYVALFHEYLDEMSELDDAEFGRLCRALIRYSQTGEPIVATGNERFYAARVMAQEDRCQASYNDTQKARSEAAKAAAEKRWHGCESMPKDANACERMLTDANGCEAMPSDSKNAISISKSISKPISTNVDRARPTLEDVRAYCAERGNKVDPERWFNYYEANGWRVGKNPMKDWKAAVRTWERNGVDKPTGKSFADMWRDMS